MGRTTRAVLGWIAISLLAAGCVDGRRGSPRPTELDTDAAAPDLDTDAGAPAPPPSVPAGGVGLRVIAAAWSDWEADVLQLQVAVSSAADGRPAPLMASAFTLETAGGAIVAAHPYEFDGCAGAVAVAPGATLTCGVGFIVPEGHGPIRVHYQADADRRAQAEIARCGAAPSGLCAYGEVCSAGSCALPCSPSAPEGACAAESERCIGGACVPACSPGAPNGWCAEGACYRGSCDASCIALYPGEGCLECMMALGDRCQAAAPVDCADETECSTCPFRGASSCDCIESAACDGCEIEARTALDCVAIACPSCVL